MSYKVDRSYSEKRNIIKWSKINLRYSLYTEYGDRFMI